MMTEKNLTPSKHKSPYPYFGGKSRIAPAIWERFGANVKNFVDPFFGSNAVLLARPGWTPAATYFETINDKSALVANFWRAIADQPDVVAFYADQPTNENDLHARHYYLVESKAALRERVEGDPEYYDPKVAGWWVWGMANWLGSGWCEGKGPWQSVDGRLVKAVQLDNNGVVRQRPQLGNSGVGINRQLVNVSGRAATGINRSTVYAGGLHRDDTGVPQNGSRGIYEWFDALKSRMRRVRVTSGDWTRVLTATPTTQIGTTAVFLDPSYAGESDRDNNLYEHEDLAVAWAVRDWALANGNNPLFRIAVCGYEADGYTFPDAWECLPWKASGGIGKSEARSKTNASRERIWFSPHCLQPQKEIPNSIAWEPIPMFASADY